MNNAYVTVAKTLDLPLKLGVRLEVERIMNRVRGDHYSELSLSDEQWMTDLQKEYRNGTH